MTVQLAKEYVHGMSGSKKDTTSYREPPIHWIMSEKFDGYRALFMYDKDNNGVFISRSGKSFMAPEWFLESMPPPALLGECILDGELWAGRDNFQMMGVVRKKEPLCEEWIPIQYQVYDITNYKDTFVKRLSKLKDITKACDVRWKILKKSLGYPYNNLDSPLVYASQTQIKSLEQMKQYYEQVVSEGGEGIMMKHPTQLYEKGRSSNLLKYKPVYDRDAIIIDYKLGKGKYSSMLGAFICKPLISCDTYSVIDDNPSHQFTLSGMDDEIRDNYQETHPVGTIISYECSGYTDKGVPRFGRYLRQRDDIVIKDIADVQEQDSKLKKVVAIFNALESHYDTLGETFRVKSYKKANGCLRTLTNDTQLMDGTLSQMDGIGKGTMDKVREIIETDTCSSYEKIRNSVDVNECKRIFRNIHGIGPVHAKKLVEAGFTTIEQLRACESIGDYLNDVQLMGLQYYEDMQQRIPYEEIQFHERFLKDKLALLLEDDPDVDLTIAGSYRRKKSTSGDIDVLIKASHKKIYESFIEILTDCGYIQCTLAQGTKKFMGMSLLDGYETPRRIDIMFTKPSEYPFAILYFTGSMEFNQRMRQEQLSLGLTLNEYSLRDNKTKRVVDHIFTTEQDIFEYMNYEYVEPWLRI